MAFNRLAGQVEPWFDRLTTNAYAPFPFATSASSVQALSLSKGGTGTAESKPAVHFIWVMTI